MLSEKNNDLDKITKGLFPALREKIRPSELQKWFSNVYVLSYNNGQLLFEVPNKFTGDVIREKYDKTIFGVFRERWFPNLRNLDIDFKTKFDLSKDKITTENNIITLAREKVLRELSANPSDLMVFFTPVFTNYLEVIRRNLKIPRYGFKNKHRRQLFFYWNNMLLDNTSKFLYPKQHIITIESVDSAIKRICKKFNLQFPNFLPLVESMLLFDDPLEFNPLLTVDSTQDQLKVDGLGYYHIHDNEKYPFSFHVAKRAKPESENYVISLNANLNNIVILALSPFTTKQGIINFLNEKWGEIKYLQKSVYVGSLPRRKIEVKLPYRDYLIYKYNRRGHLSKDISKKLITNYGIKIESTTIRKVCERLRKKLTQFYQV